MHRASIPQDTSRIGTVRMKQEEETDTRIMKESSKKSGRKERGHEGKKVPDLTIELLDGRESPYHR